MSAVCLCIELSKFVAIVTKACVHSTMHRYHKNEFSLLELYQYISVLSLSLICVG